MMKIFFERGQITLQGLFETACALRKLNKRSHVNETFTFKLPKDFEGANEVTITPFLEDNCKGKNNSKQYDENIVFHIEYHTDIQISASNSESQLM